MKTYFERAIRRIFQMITRQSVIIDPLSASNKECKSPASICSEEGSVKGHETSSLAASFVFVEEPRPIRSELRRHSTVIRTSHEDDEFKSPIPLLKGEERQALIHEVTLVHPLEIVSGPFPLLVTNYRLIVCENLFIPLTSVLDLKVQRLVSNGFGLDVKTKESRFFQFNVPEKSGDKSSLIKLLNSLVFSIPPSQLVAMYRRVRGWGKLSSPVYDLGRELARMSGSSDRVEISDVNCHFQVCPTYPQRFIVPKGVSSETSIGSSKFRDKGRVPVLSWMSSTGGSIWRSSQPKSSILNRSVEDEDYLKKTGIMFIIDCRPMLNAYANIANGAGVESLGNYHKGIELWFAGIHNIHHVRESWEKMFLLAQQHYSKTNNSGGGSSWFVGLENSAWIEYMQSILRAASILSEKIHEAKIPLLCRCSHGLDRTPQVVSLAMLSLDRYYRTIEGFAVLIEKEWISMGHRFHSRYCIGQNPHDDVSPIFSQWIECVYQLMIQFPEEFEFNPKYLLAILFGFLSGRFSNFLFDCEKERIDNGIDTREISDCLWAELWTRRSEYLNSNFQSNGDVKRLEIDYRISRLQVFTDLWLSHSRITSI